MGERDWTHRFLVYSPTVAKALPKASQKRRKNIAKASKLGRVRMSVYLRGKGNQAAINASF
jgi:hypothetical protein